MVCAKSNRIHYKHNQRDFAKLPLALLIYSVNRFGEISPLRQILKSIWSLLKGLFSNVQNFVTNLAFLTLG